MRPVLAMLVVLMSLASTTARADIPPPPYEGPTYKILAGLDFTRSSVSPAASNGLFPHHRRSYFVITLDGCASRSKNCDLVTRRGVKGWAVTKANGQPIWGDDLQSLINVFAAAKPGSKVTLVFTRDTEQSPPVTVDLAVDAR